MSAPMTTPTTTQGALVRTPKHPVPVDVRDRMLTVMRRGTNLDPDPRTRGTRKVPMTEEERKEKARVYAQDLRARRKTERDGASEGAGHVGHD